MTKPKAEPQNLVQRLTRYVGLEADAVETYALAARQLRDLDAVEAVEAVGAFRRQHAAQRDELSRLLGEAGGKAFDPFRPRRPLMREGGLLGAYVEAGRAH